MLFKFNTSDKCASIYIGPMYTIAIDLNSIVGTRREMQTQYCLLRVE